MHWIVWLAVGWIALAVAVALIAGRGIRMRDERDTFPPPSEGRDSGDATEDD
ncbi:hypothetical protein [Rhodococcus sp. OK519]|uniref:hypothetical protein n=1 Tax=Rhodococcus sp. OK519 TaxID=2135729 RepID=UPI0015E63CE0